MMRDYYNEYDCDPAAWLRGLIDEELIPDGLVDTRSIVDIDAADLAGFRQCHFFAGIGGWPLALQLAGWPEDRPVWTGSCPCQPFSVAGKGLGERDERHLWPAFFRLIEKCRPATIFGEQVASKAGRVWLAGVFADLEGLGYAVAGADLCAAGVSAPHIRQRIFWVSNADGTECQRIIGESESAGRAGFADGGWLVHADVHRFIEGSEASSPSRYRDPADATGIWSESRLILCRDGKHRRIPTEPGLFPLADGLSYRVGKRRSVRPALLKGAGNAIVPQVAAEFIGAFLKSERI